VSPKLAAPEGILAVEGFRAMGVAAGLKADRPDVALIVSDRPGTQGAAVFTQNAFAAAPVHISRQHVADGDVRAIVVNAGNANACTGRQGLRDALRMARLTAEVLDLAPEQVVVASTGIIGRPLPMDKVEAGIRDCAARLGEAKGSEAAHAILTTDSGPKEVARTAAACGRTFRVAGIAKGAGMIHPDMATMLAFLVTDAPVDAEHLRTALKEASDRSFNQITVDGDESTNDMAVLLANGAEGGTKIAPGHEAWPAFHDAVTAVCTDLARRIAADGEGATRLLEVHVQGARDDEQARRAARAVAASGLVKCAVHGGDPNWGRVLAAIGQSRVEADPGRVSLWIGSGNGRACVLRDGEPDEASLHEAAEALQAPEVTLTIDVAAGDSEGRAWGCDLTEDYVRFNAQYPT